MESPQTPERSRYSFAAISPLPSSAHKLEDSFPGILPPPVFKTLHAEVENSISNNFCSSEDDPFVGSYNSSSSIKKKPHELSAAADSFVPIAPAMKPKSSNKPKLSVVTDARATPRKLPPLVLGSFATPSTMSEGTLREPKSVDEPKEWEGIFDRVYPTGEFTGDKFSRYPKFSGIPESLSIDTIEKSIKRCKTCDVPRRIVNVGHLRTEGIIVLQYDRIDDAVNATGEIPYHNKTWKPEGYLNARQFSEALNGKDGPLWSPYKGQLSVIGDWRGVEKFTASEITDYLVQTMKGQGPILAWEQIKTTDRQVFIRMEFFDIHDTEKALITLDGSKDGDLVLIVKEYVPDFEKHPIPAMNPNSLFDLAQSVNGTMRPFLLPDASFFSTPNVRATSSFSNVPAGFSSDVRVTSATNNRIVASSDVGMSFSSSNTAIATPSNAQKSFPAGKNSFNAPSNARKSFGMTGQNVSGYGAQQSLAIAPRPFGTYAIPPNPNAPSQPRYVPFGMPHSGHHHPGSTGFGPEFAVPFLTSQAQHPSGRVAQSGGHRDPFNNHNPQANNIVSLYRIHRGMDVRTTIMLRNIPNKMHQPELKELIDSTNFGEYDFMYLRIDFANNCNVGYAFINFVDPMGVAKFVTARSGVKWPGYNSEKVAAVCYATIQGKDCLIQKFRNSSVMLEDPTFRPKLFHTGTGPMAGREEAFPGPDNDTKLRRSIENAGAVGLFAPRAGQNFRDAQRHRRSQYDRGTHFAQIEEESFGPAPQAREDDSGSGMPYIPHPLPPNMTL